MDAAITSQVAQNREKLNPIIKTILLCGKQKLALREHRENEV